MSEAFKGKSHKRAKVSRRAVVAGDAWALPVVTLGIPAPVMAASCDPIGCVTLRRAGTIFYTNNPCTPITLDGRQSTSSSLGIFFVNTTTLTTIAGVTFRFLCTNAGYTFTGALAGWSNLVYTGTTRIISGVTYYVYEATYGGTIVPINGTTRLNYYWTSTNCRAHSTLRMEAQATINGSVQVVTGNAVTI
jgi:hypothetical protein